MLQIPPMDLGQVEVIKGVASALYGSSALGGVINLVSRQPRADRPERELLVNRTSRGGTDGVVWLSGKPREHWGYTLLGGAHYRNGPTSIVTMDRPAGLPTRARQTATALGKRQWIRCS